MFRQFELERFFAKHEFTCKLALCCSDPESFTIQELLDLTDNPSFYQQKLLNMKLCYTESPGHPELRKAIVDYVYDGNNNGLIGGDNILVHTGAEEVLFTISASILSEGDEVIIQTPCYQSHYELARARGCKIIELPTTLVSNESEEKWVLDLESLESLITSKTKMILVNSPHNPTGFHFSSSEQSKLVEIISRHPNIWLVSDEVNRYSEHESNLLLPSFCQLYKRCVAVGVLSKTYSMPGLRIGWAACQDKELLNALAKCKDYTTITNPGPSELLAQIGLQVSSKILARNANIYRTNLDLLDAFFLDYKTYFQWVRPKTGIVGFVGLKVNSFSKSFFELNSSIKEELGNEDLTGPADIFAYKLLKQEGVLLAPGAKFDPADSGRFNTYFRIGFGRLDLPQGLKLFRKFMEGHVLSTESDLSAF